MKPTLQGRRLHGNMHGWARFSAPVRPGGMKLHDKRRARTINLEVEADGTSIRISKLRRVIKNIGNGAEASSKSRAAFNHTRVSPAYHA